MANIKSQIKRNKQNEKAHQRNKAAKSSLRTSVRKFREAADRGNLDEAWIALRTACRQLDKAVSKGVIHKNQAANRKSAIAKRYAELAARSQVGARSAGAGPAGELRSSPAGVSGWRRSCAPLVPARRLRWPLRL